MKFYKKKKKKKGKRGGKRQEKETKSRHLYLIWTNLSRNLEVSPGKLKKGGSYRDWAWRHPLQKPPLMEVALLFILLLFIFLSLPHPPIYNGLCCKCSLVSQLFVTQQVFNPQKAYLQ